MQLGLGNALGEDRDATPVEGVEHTEEGTVQSGGDPYQGEVLWGWEEGEHRSSKGNIAVSGMCWHAYGRMQQGVRQATGDR